MELADDQAKDIGAEAISNVKMSKEKWEQSEIQSIRNNIIVDGRIIKIVKSSGMKNTNVRYVLNYIKSHQS